MVRTTFPHFVLLGIYSEIPLRTDKLTAKAQKITIKLPWEVTTIYSEAVKQSGHQSDDEEDEDDLEAQEASLERLKVRYRRVYRVRSTYGEIPGSGRCHEANDTRGISTLFGLSTSVVLVSQRCVMCLSLIPAIVLLSGLSSHSQTIQGIPKLAHTP